MHRIETTISTKCKLIVETREQIEFDENYKYVEFVLSELINPWETLMISDVPTVYQTDLYGDGLYVYYRMKVCTKDAALIYTDNDLYVDNNVLYIKGDKVKNLEELLPYFNITYDVSKDAFSLCRINHCLENMQRKIIFSGCGTWKCKNKTSEDKALRDYLFTTVFVLRRLIEQRRYEEAKDILAFINTCEGVCDVLNVNTSRGCGCGGKK